MAPPILLLGAVWDGWCCCIYIVGLERRGGGVLFIIFVCFLSSFVPSSFRPRSSAATPGIETDPITIDIRVYICISTYICTRNIDLDLDLNPTNDALPPSIHPSIHPTPTPRPPTSHATSIPTARNQAIHLHLQHLLAKPHTPAFPAASYPRDRFSFEIPSRRVVGVVRVGMVAPSVSRPTADPETP
jgi:hypothetical protein